MIHFAGGVSGHNMGWVLQPVRKSMQSEQSPGEKSAKSGGKTAN